MTTTTRKPSAQQLAAKIEDQLGTLDVWYPEAGDEARRVLNLSVPLARMLVAGMVDRVTASGRDVLEDATSSLAAILDLIDDDSYQRLVKTGSWTVMWDWTRPAAGVAFV
jgi:hypothetical protein